MAQDTRRVQEQQKLQEQQGKHNRVIKRGYHPNGFTATHKLGPMYSYILLVFKNYHFYFFFLLIVHCNLSTLWFLNTNNM